MRGTFSMLESVLRCTGTLLVYSLGLVFRWRDIAMVAPLVPLLAFLAALCVPESPVYLVTRGKVSEAEAGLKRMYGPQHDSLREVTIIRDNLAALRAARERKSDYVRSMGQHPEIYKPFLIIVTLSLVQQFSGVSVIRAYVVKMFDAVFTHHSNTQLNTNATVFMEDRECVSSPL